ncbi:NosD domain-containing protein [Anaeromicrobium sediminis]|uniref:Periplasmic copper-binding protein NosD beta helix domain-containing protein n=1 Tax=Anaeromicrobium sediminis TaxID=1478221 RepID=A0A267MQW8_9FIRM|nr:NosD domain-containing protein [Anaeromicrobium sediminis]PAB61163.1 hypothetical protein CCE28_01690 [Anaeromicrobium sediminis]
MAIINVPNDFSTIQEAVDIVSEGDVILVSPKENMEPYNEEVHITTNNIRIIANGKNVLLDGTIGSLDIAFSITSVTDVSGVEIKGFKIQNYNDGILISGGNYNRIIGNKIMVTHRGIICALSVGNLIWKNEVKGNGNGDGIYVGLQSDSNWIIENVVHGYNVGLRIEESRGNALACNLSFNNGIGFALFPSPNTLLLGNEVFKTSGQRIISSPNSVLINNKINCNDGELVVSIESKNCILSENEIKRNSDNGIASGGDFTIIEENNIQENKEDGIIVLNKNTIIRNCIECNKANGINIEGDENNVVQNKVCNNKVLDIDDNGTDNEFADNKCSTSDPQDICKNCHYKYYHYGYCPYKDYYCEYCPYKYTKYCPCRYEHDYD